MRIASLVVLIIVAMVFGFWLGWVRAPGPGEVCDHIIEVTKREAEDRSMQMESEAALIGQMRDKCMKHKLDKIQLRGRLVWAEYAKCITGSTSLDEIGRC